jgi:tRNA-dihydrouridine synthase
MKNEVDVVVRVRGMYGSYVYRPTTKTEAFEAREYLQQVAAGSSVEIIIVHGRSTYAEYAPYRDVSSLEAIESKVRDLIVGIGVI